MAPLLTTLFGLAFWALAMVILASVIFYFLPTLVASFRGHPNTGVIGWINLFLGWTMVGWFGTLIWAFLPGSPGLAVPAAATTGISPRGRPMKTVN